MSHVEIPSIPGFGGQLNAAGAAFESAVAVWNHAPDHRPVLVATCTDEKDVSAALRWAREQDLPISARAGGHSYTAASVVSGGVVLDLRLLREITLSDGDALVSVGAGLRWADVDDVLGPRGRAVPGGSVSKVGVAGFTLGTGLGWLGRTAGPAGDSLVAARVVTADGDVLDVSEHDHPDLFWALRGGCGNFGIVIRFTLRTQPLRTVLAGPLVYRIADAAAALRQLATVTPELPAEVNWTGVLTTPPPEAGLPQQLAGQALLLVPMLYVGDPEDGERALAGLRAIGTPVADLVAPVSWGSFGRQTDDAAPEGRCWDVRSEWMTGLDDERIEAGVDFARSAPSSYCEFLWRPLGGRLDASDKPDTPFSWRQAGYLLEVIASWLPGERSDAAQAWMRSGWRSQLPLSAGGPCVSHIGLDEGPERVAAAYSPDKLERLREVKRRYDPDNVFRSVQNIAP